MSKELIELLWNTVMVIGGLVGFYFVLQFIREIIKIKDDQRKMWLQKYENLRKTTRSNQKNKDQIPLLKDVE
jgi:hypothetical protein